MPSISAGLSPASAIALSAASACNWICDMSGMTPSRVVSAAPTIAIDFGFIALPRDRAEERQSDLVVELFEHHLDRHVELQCLRGLRTADDVGHQPRPFVQLNDSDRIRRGEARYRAVVDHIGIKPPFSRGGEHTYLARGTSRTKRARREVDFAASIAALQAQFAGARAVPEMLRLRRRLRPCPSCFRHARSIPTLTRAAVWGKRKSRNELEDEMADRGKTITPAELRAWLHDGEEIAIVDAREEGSFHDRHLLMASCLPLSRLELLAAGLLPRRGVRIVVTDAGEGLARRAAARLSEGGYSNVSTLEGGVAAWQAAGFPVYSGVHVPSKAFAEVVEHECGTPWISVEELAERQRRGDNMVVFDSRSYEEYHSNSIPGAISVPGAELVYRFTELVPTPDTFVVVNCGGRTRSIIGAQSLIEAGVPNRVVSLKDGTMAWHLAGFDVVGGADRRAPAVTAQGVAAARRRAEAVARRYGVPVIDHATLAQWRDEAERRTLYVLDVRDPAEYRTGHLPGS